MKNQVLKILVVDDEEAIRHFLRASLAAYQHHILEVANGEEAIRLSYEARPDLIILDLGLPDMDGVDVLGEIRQFSQVPVIILSVRNSEADKINALDAGADDYLTKPFGIGELLARIRGVMRRVYVLPPNEVYEIGGLKMDITRRQVLVQGKEASLTPTEFDILKLFIQNAGRVLTHRQIIDQIWGTNTGEEARLLRVNISNLRHKIEPDPNRPQYIRTDLGVGYRLNDQEG